MRHSRRHAMNPATITKKMTSARSAFSVMALPHVELVELVLMSSVETPSSAAKASWIACRTVSG